METKTFSAQLKEFWAAQSLRDKLMFGAFLSIATVFDSLLYNHFGPEYYSEGMFGIMLKKSYPDFFYGPYQRLKFEAFRQLMPVLQKIFDEYFGTKAFRKHSRKHVFFR